MSNSKYGRIIAIATAVCVILLGVAYIICTAHLYFTGGNQPYSVERVGAYLKWLIIPSAITILLAIGGIVYNVVTSETVEKNTERTSGELLESFEKRYKLDDFDGDTIALVRKEKRGIKNLNICFALVSAVLFVASFVYLVFVADYTVENLNADVMAAFAVSLPLCAIGLAVHIPRIYLCELSAKHQLELMKESIKKHGAPKVQKAENTEKDKKAIMVARYSVLGIALVLVVLGIFNGGIADVLAKAVKICTECIGLG
jgi:uncharacterized membrane protein (DUF485 family)